MSLKSKKIGILTYHYSDNYGAVLQAFSLCNVLKKQGYQVHIINLIPKESFIGKIKKLLKKPLIKSFVNFRKEYFNLYPNEKLTYESLKSLEISDFHAIIVGSDQVWRKDYTKGLEFSYFLDFVPNHIKKISYAASFGLDYYQGTPKEISKIRNELKTFSAISVREKTGMRICNKDFGIEAVLVLDPVLLVSPELFDFEYNEKPSKSILTQYLLDPTPEKLSIVNQVSKEKSLSIYVNYKKASKPISMKSYIINRRNEYFPTVESWVWGIKNAEFVVTDSFHGLAFSILFKKQFICIVNEKRGKSRMLGLLELLGLSHLALYETSLQSFSISNYSEIDFNTVDTKLNTLREKSLNFLMDALK